MSKFVIILLFVTCVCQGIIISKQKELVKKGIEVVYLKEYALKDCSFKLKTYEGLYE